MTAQTQDSTAPRMLKPEEVKLRRDEDDRVYAEIAGESVPVKRVAAAFPLTEPHRMVNLFGQEGTLIGIITEMRHMDNASARILAEELEKAYFMPKITDIFAVEEKLGIEHWDVQTNKGPRIFQVRDTRRNIRRLTPTRFVIKDVDANRYEIRDWTALPRAAQGLITRLL